jgi:multicomponent Na+:H+ antiporter subunit C
MTTFELYLFCGGALVLIGLYAVARRQHLLHKLLGINVMGSGVFMILLSLAARGETADAVPQALVLTGIVVAISATALGLTLMQRMAELASAKSPEQAVTLDEERP